MKSHIGNMRQALHIAISCDPIRNSILASVVCALFSVASTSMTLFDRTRTETPI